MQKDKKKYYKLASLDEDKVMATEMFEHAHFLYSTRSVEETVTVLKKLGLEDIAKKALS